MNDIKIQLEIFDVAKELEKVYADVEKARSDAYTLNQAIKNSNWSGTSRNKCVDITDITSKYHDDVLFLIESLKHHISTLITDIDEFGGISVRIKELSSAL